MLIYLLLLFFFFVFLITSWQFKYKEDTSATHPILLDEPKLEVYPSLLHAFPLSCVSMCNLFSFFFFIIIIHSSLFFSLFICFQTGPEPLSVYHPTSEEIYAAMGTPMEDFFDGVDIVAEAIAFTFATAQGVPVEASIPSPKPVPFKESAQIERVGKSIPIPAEIHTPQK